MTVTNALTISATTINMGTFEMSRVSFNATPVLTARAIADVLGTNRRAISQAYRNNRGRFVEGVDVIHLDSTTAGAAGFPFVKQVTGHSLTALNLFRYSSAGITLFTERGVALLATIVTTEEAWELRKTFINAYFTLAEMATGALTAQEGAVQAAKVVADGSALLGVDLQPAGDVVAVVAVGRNAPDVLTQPVDKALALLQQAALALETEKRANRTKALGFEAATKWEQLFKAEQAKNDELRRKLAKAEHGNAGVSDLKEQLWRATSALNLNRKAKERVTEKLMATMDKMVAVKQERDAYKQRLDAISAAVNPL